MADLALTRMTAAEFLAMPESSKIIELINGEVIMAPSPVDPHQEALGNLYFSLRQGTPSGTWRVAPCDVYLDEANVLQPDIFWVSPTNENCQLVDGKYWHGAPDLVIEILSPGSTRQDRGEKYDLYAKHGVREYWMVDTEELYIEVYCWREGKFERQGFYGVGEQFVSPALNGASHNVETLLKS